MYANKECDCTQCIVSNALIMQVNTYIAMAKRILTAFEHQAQELTMKSSVHKLEHKCCGLPKKWKEELENV